MGLFSINISGRGIRVSLGPRIFRFHFGNGRPRITSGAGPVSYSKTLGKKSPPRKPAKKN